MECPGDAGSLATAAIRPANQTQPRPAISHVLGVVGHRRVRPEDYPALRAALAAVFVEFRAAYPHTPLVLLSMLAEGADQLAAEVALDAARTDGVPADQVAVRAPLPMPEGAYRASTSFSTEDSRSRLNRLLADPRVESFAVPLPPALAPADDQTWQPVASGQASAERDLRRACYANAGVYLARHCHALIALWDGADPDPAHPSGTAEFVQFKLTGRAPAKYPGKDSEPLGFRGDRGPVIVLHTPRADAGAALAVSAGTRDVRLPSDKKPFEEPLGDVPLARRISPARRFGGRVLTALGISGRGHAATGEVKSELRQFRETCQMVDDFNRDVAGTDDCLGKRLGRVEALLPSRPPVAEGPAASLRRIIAVREAAAHLAERLQAKLERAQNALFVLLLGAVAFFHFYAHWFGMDGGHPVHRPLFLWAFLAALALAAALVAWVWWERLDQRRLDYRALAEAVRVRRAWALAGIDASVADSYLAQLRGEMAWARRALQHLCPPPQVWKQEFAGLTDDLKHERLRYVDETWVAEQIAHFRKMHYANHRRAIRLRVSGFLLALCGWVVWLLPFVTVEHPHLVVLLGSGLLVVAGGLLIAISEHRSHEELAKQYERMQVVFENGERELQGRLARHDFTGAQSVLKALGREAITEHAEWLILRRARPFELHIG